MPRKKKPELTLVDGMGKMPQLAEETSFPPRLCLWSTAGASPTWAPGTLAESLEALAATGLYSGVRPNQEVPLIEDIALELLQRAVREELFRWKGDI